MTLSISDRIRASKIVTALRNQSNRADVSQLLGISTCYITCIENMTKRHRGGDELHYVLPPKIIQRVLDWAEEYRKSVRVV